MGITKWIRIHFWWKCELPQTFRLSNRQHVLKLKKKVSTFLGAVILVVLEIYQAEIKASVHKDLCIKHL